MKSTVTGEHVLSFEGFNLSGGQYKKIFETEKTREIEIKRFMTYTNATFTYGDKELAPQWVEIKDYDAANVGQFLPNYIPGNERWKVNIWLSENDEIVSGITYYVIIRDDAKLFDSKWKK